MKPEISIPIIFRDKIPVLSSSVSWLMGLCLAVLCIIYVCMVPADYASPEMRVGYFILVVPEGLKEASGWAIAGLVLLFPLSLLLKRSIPGMLVLETGKLILHKASSVEVLPVESITRLFINDLCHWGDRQKFETEVMIKAARKPTTLFLLANYHDTGLLVEHLAQYPGLEPYFTAGRSLDIYKDD